MISNLTPNPHVPPIVADGFVTFIFEEALATHVVTRQIPEYMNYVEVQADPTRSATQ